VFKWTPTIQIHPKGQLVGFIYQLTLTSKLLLNSLEYRNPLAEYRSGRVKKKQMD
jgi:hypothetical protein